MTMEKVLEKNVAEGRESPMDAEHPFVNFTLIRVDTEWNFLEGSEKTRGIEDFRSALVDYRGKLEVDFYYTVGLTENSDFLLRIKSDSMATIQNFLSNTCRSGFGHYLDRIESFIGVTAPPTSIKKLFEKFPARDTFDAVEETDSYAVILPLTKSLDWWLLPDSEKAEMLTEYFKLMEKFSDKIHQRIYYSVGLDDQDFILYLESADLESINELMTSLWFLKDSRFTNRIGSPTMLGTVMGVGEILNQYRL
jgi:chlorite dismutase